MAETLVELVAKISADATELKGSLADAERKTEASSKRMADSLKKVGLAMAASGAAITAALGLMGKAAIDEEINIKRLATTMKNVGVSYDDVKDSLEAVIATTQRKTGVADNEQRDILNRLILVTGDYNKALQLLPTVLDLAAAGSMDATTAATYLGKAYLDLEAGAETVSVRFGQASLQFQSMEDIQNRVAGSAEALVNPFSVLSATMGDVAETIGMNLIPMIEGAVDKIVDITIKIQDWIKENPELSSQLTHIGLGIGIVSIAVGGLILILPHLIDSYKALTLVINVATTSMWGFYATLVAIPFVATAAAIAISELTGNTRRMNEAGQTLWYQNIGNWILNQLGLTKAIETTTGKTSTLMQELKNLGLTGDELTYTFKLLAEAGYLSIGTSTIEQVRVYTEAIKKAKEGVEGATNAQLELDIQTRAVKQVIGRATWEADGYTLSMQLFTQAEIDAAIASGKKVEKLEVQTDITNEGAEALDNYKKSVNSVVSAIMTATGEMQRFSGQYPTTWGAPSAPLRPGQVVAPGVVALQHGGIITQPTLAMVGEGGPEAVVPLNEVGGITINFTQPVFFDREDTMNRFVQIIRKGIQRQDRLRFGNAFKGG